MRRRHEIQPINWSTHTFSQLQQRKFEASKRRLEKIPPIELDTCTDANADTLWRFSMYAEEQPDSGLHTADELKAMVFNSLPAETLLLSEEEHQMLAYLLSGDESKRGGAPNPIAVENLTRRLWCTVHIDAHGRAAVRVNPMVGIPLTMMLMSPAHQEMRQKVQNVYHAIRNALDLFGAVSEDDALSLLWTEVLRGSPANDARIAKRWIHTSFDYITGTPNLLVHEGMADPYGFRDKLYDADQAIFGLSEETVMSVTTAAADALEMMTNTITGAVRGEMDAETLAMDLQMLACQGVSIDEMKSVLCAGLMVAPTANMLEALKMLKVSSPGWGRFGTGVVV